MVVVICLSLTVFPRDVIVTNVVNVSGLQYMSLPTIFRWTTVHMLFCKINHHIWAYMSMAPLEVRNGTLHVYRVFVKENCL